MPWTRLDEGFSDHPKIQSVGPLAELLQVRALLFSNRYLTDGHVPSSVLPTLARGLDHIRVAGRRVTPADLVEKLVAAGVWDVAGDGYEIHDFADFQPSRAKVLADREAAKSRMKRLRGSAEVRANTESTSREVRDPVPSRPVSVPVRAPSTTVSHLRSDEYEVDQWLERHGMPAGDRRLFLDQLRIEGNQKKSGGLRSLDHWALKAPSPGRVCVLEERWGEWRNARLEREKHQPIPEIPGLDGLVDTLRMPA